MKLFIVEPSFSNKSTILAKKLAEANNLKICSKHSSVVSENTNYMDIDEINLAFKNNALLYIDYTDSDITCMTIDNYYSSDIIPIKIHEFNNIIKTYLSDILIIWVDSINNKEINKKILRKNIANTKHLIENIESLNIKYLYFLKEKDEDIINVVNRYLNGTNEERRNIEYEYS